MMSIKLPVHLSSKPSTHGSHFRLAVLPVMVAIMVLGLLIFGRTFGDEFQNSPFAETIPGLTDADSLPLEEPATEPADGPTEYDPIRIIGNYRQTWSGGIEEQPETIELIRGQCRIVQGEATLTAQKVVVWRTANDERRVLTVFAEGGAVLSKPGWRMKQPTMLIDLVTIAGVEVEAAKSVSNVDGSDDPLFRRAKESRQKVKRPFLKQTQYQVPAGQNQPVPFSTQPVLPPINLAPNGTSGGVPAGTPSGPAFSPLPAGPIPQLQYSPRPIRHVVVSPRSSVPYNIKSRLSTDSTPPEQITVLTRGVNVLIEGVPEVGQIDLTADRIVIWAEADETGNFRPELFQDANAPLQLYLEGNIEIRSGDNLLRSSRAFYDVKENRALFLDTELRARIPDLDGDLRVRAGRIRQLSQNNFHAQDAWVTASQFGKPTYRLQASDIFLENRQVEPWVGGSTPSFDPVTGQPRPTTTPWVTSMNNALIFRDIPVFYAPYLSSPADDPNIPLRSVTLAQDRIFGGQIETVWNLSKLLGLNMPRGSRWDLGINYYTDRGASLGSRLEYGGANLGNIPGTYFGRADAFYIHDFGQDNLGSDRRSLEPEQKDRGRLLWRHRQQMPYNTVFSGELGFVSDRNFLEQYYENEWDEQKDHETTLSLGQQFDNLNWSIFGRTRLNEFEYETEWLPKANLTVLGEPVFGSNLTWSSRSSVGYARLRTAEAPYNPTEDIFTPTPYYTTASGLVTHTRHELSLPFNVGPVNIAPYVLGEAAYWNESLTNQSINRLYGSAGIRASVLFWKVFPYIRSDIFNLNGLAHKHTLGIDYHYDDVTEDFQNIPNYNEFDDNAQERFRTRFPINSFGSPMLPLLPGFGISPFDPRYYAIRRGAGRHVTSPYNELVDDQHVVRLTSRHRLQTKVGPPERLRIKDWMTLDLGLSYFPDDQDNFGEDLGLFDAHYEWNLGERTRILSNAQFDFFDGAPKLWDIGYLSQRSARGSLYVGYRQIKGGPLDSQILSSSLSYAMSEKWIATFGTAYDIGENEDRGQSLTVTRVGADFLIHMGAGIDISKNNVGLSLSIEPRVGAFDNSSTQLSSLLGIRQ